MTKTNKSKSPICELDASIFNNNTIGDLSDLGITFFASLCGRNRGAFVLHPSDGHTWGCLSFPPNFAELAGASDTDFYFKDANALKDAYKAGNLTASDTVKVLDFFLQNVYKSSADVDKNPLACEMGGIARLKCDDVTSAIGNIRSVTMAGVFVPAPSVTGGKVLSLDEATSFYTLDDFKAMSVMGLNTVQIPFPVSAFLHNDTQTATIVHLTTVLEMIQKTGLQVIIELAGDDNDTAVAAASKYAASQSGSVLALTVPSIDSVHAARASAPDLTLFVPVKPSAIIGLKFPDANIYAAMDMDHSTDIADIASSASQDDRMKMFYHEEKMCTYRSPLEYSACFNGIPVFVAHGFDLSIDDCVNYGTSKFVDYGQCDRLNETVNSPWWDRHRASFAARQIFTYEQGLGWSYTAWKLFDDDDSGLLDSPAKLLALKNTAAAGLLPPLVGYTSDDSVLLACLNPPVSDFILGDDTLSPTPAPPPDCGNGWWNASIKDCTYWVPPPTDPPSVQVTYEAVVCPDPLTTTAEIKSGVIGAVIAFLVFGIVSALYGRRSGYTRIE